MSSAPLVCLCLLVFSSLAYGASRSGLIPRLYRHIDNIEMGQGLTNGFEFHNCGGPKDLANFTSFSVTPDPIALPGKVKVAFEVDVKEQLGGKQLNVNVTLLVREAGSAWTEIPCVLEVGSCLYRDACSYLEGIEECPEALTKHGIPCKCPFKPGKYHLPATSFDIPEGPPSADYSVRVVVTQADKPVACAAVTATIA